MDRKSKQASTLNSERKCEFGVDELRCEGGSFGGSLSERDLLSIVRGRVLEESTIGDDFGTRGGRDISCGSSGILIFETAVDSQSRPIDIDIRLFPACVQCLSR